MRVFLNGSSSWAAKPLAGVSALDRMASAWKAVTSFDPLLFPEENPDQDAPSIWVNGLFPLWESGDLTQILSSFPETDALWLYSKEDAHSGVLRLAADLPFPNHFDISHLESKYGSRLHTAEMSEPTWRPLINGHDFADLSGCLFARNLNAALDAGVCIAAPGQTWIEDGVVLAPGVSLGPCVYLARGTRLEAGVSVQLGSWLKDVTIASGTVV